MSRPRTSTPLAYSETATLTMFAIRWTGGSCARPTPASDAISHIPAAARGGTGRKFIAEQIYRDSEPANTSNRSLGAEHDDRAGDTMRVSQRDVDGRHGQLAGALLGHAMKPDRRDAAIV